jgi:hypothetical protein
MKSNVMVSVSLLAIGLSAGVPAGAVEVTHGIAATAVPAMTGTQLAAGDKYAALRHRCCRWDPVHHRRHCWWVPAGAMCRLRS